MKILLIICTLVLSSSVMAGGIMQFTPAGFERLKQEHTPVLIDVYASWCPTCRAQANVIKAFFFKNSHSKLTVLKVDFDT